MYTQSIYSMGVFHKNSFPPPYPLFLKSLFFPSLSPLLKIIIFPQKLCMCARSANFGLGLKRMKNISLMSNFSFSPRSSKINFSRGRGWGFLKYINTSRFIPYRSSNVMKEEVRNLYIREYCKNDFTNVAELIPLMLCDQNPPQ